MSARSRVTYALIDQAATSGANLALFSYVASHSSTHALGQFSISQAAIAFATAAARNTVGVEALTGRSNRTHSSPLALGLTLHSMMWFLASIPLQVAARTPSIIIISGIIGVLANGALDGLRITNIAIGRLRHAATYNVLALSCATAALPLSTTWTLCTALFYLTLLIVTFCMLTWRHLLSDRSSRGVGLRYSIKTARSNTSLTLLYVSNALVPLLLPAVIAIASDLHTTAVVRSAQTLTALGLQVPQGLQPVALARASRSPRSSRIGLDRTIASWLTIGLISVSLLGAVALALPGTVGSFILGPSWHAAKEVLPLFIFGSALQTYITALELDLKARGTLREAPRMRMIGMALSLALAACAAHMAGEKGVALALIAVNSWMAVIFFKIHRPPGARKFRNP